MCHTRPVCLFLSVCIADCLFVCKVNRFSVIVKVHMQHFLNKSETIVCVFNKKKGTVPRLIFTIRSLQHKHKLLEKNIFNNHTCQKEADA